jgi:hypothetical protein
MWRPVPLGRRASHDIADERNHPIERAALDAALAREASAAPAGVEHDPRGDFSTVGEAQAKTATRERCGRGNRSADRNSRPGRACCFAQQRMLPK